MKHKSKRLLSILLLLALALSYVPSFSTTALAAETYPPYLAFRGTAPSSIKNTENNKLKLRTP